MTATDNPQLFDGFASDYDVIAEVNPVTDFFIDRLPDRRGRALDAGCGTGRLALELSAHFDDVVGIDRSAPMLEIARRERAAPNITYVESEIDGCDLAGRFDLICSATTFHHLPDVASTLERLVEALNPGGRILIVDCVQKRPRLPAPLFRAFLRVEAMAMLALDALRRGSTEARRIHRARTNRAWIEHLVSDRFLSQSEFVRVYGAALPGATFTPIRFFEAVEWEKPG